MRIYKYDDTTKQLTPQRMESVDSKTEDTSRITGSDKTTQQQFNNIIGAMVSTLVGNDSNKSVREISAEELAEQLIPENASASLDTLHEIAEWIQGHPEDAAEMNQRISDLESATDTLEEAVPFVLYIQNGVYGYKQTDGTFVPFKSQADIDAAVAAAAPVGNATAADVLSGKTFSNSSDKGITGSMPSRSNGTQAVGSGIDSTGPLVYFPYGYYPSYSENRAYVYMTAAQAVAACPSQTKSTTASRSAQTITPDSGKLLSSVSIAKYPDASGNYTCGSNNGAASSNDMGATNNYRYVNATNVYNKGKADGFTNSLTVIATQSHYKNINFSLTAAQTSGYRCLLMLVGGATLNASADITVQGNSASNWPRVAIYETTINANNANGGVLAIFKANTSQIGVATYPGVSSTTMKAMYAAIVGLK